MPFQGADYTGQVSVKGSNWGWYTLSCSDDGSHGDLTAGDGIYTFMLSENIGAHDGLLYSGNQPEFVFALSGVEYKDSGSARPIAISAYVDNGSGWSSVPVEIQSSGDHNTYVNVP